MRAILNAALLCLGLLCWTAASAQSPLLSDNADSIAVVVGNKIYKQTSAVDFAHNDADAMRSYLIGTLRFREQNVFLLKDATLGELTQMFGSEVNPQGGQLWRRAVEKRSNIFVYYSGHGVPDLTTRQPFLLPQDGNPNSSESGYALQTLYRNLELVRQKIGPQRQLIVMIDACFTGETGRKGESLLAVSAPGFTPARPRVGSGIVKLVATSGATPANWDQETKLGLFTSRFLMGAAGLARPSAAGDAVPVNLSDLKRYLTEVVATTARRDSGREQVPEIDEVALSLPIGRPVPVVAGLVATAQDDAAWQKVPVTKERAALEDYVASCAAPCRYREEALGHLREQERRSETAADRQNWQRLSVAGKYAEYLKGCGVVCAYGGLAEEYLRLSRDNGDPTVRRCDQLAGNATDRDRNPQFAGVAEQDIRADEAIIACLAAIKVQPQLQRLSYQLGRAYQKAERPKDALASYRRAAETGHVAAMAALGFMFNRFDEGIQNPSEARLWYEKAAANGDPDAMVSFGFMLQMGRGGTENRSEARRWYEKGAQAGNTAAMMALADMLYQGHGGPEDKAGARRWYEKAVQSGHSGAMVPLGVMLADGEGGGQDEVAARRWLEQAVAVDDLDAMGFLGAMLEEGQGGPPNLPEARRLYEKVAEIGIPAMMTRLARMLNEGRGGPVDLPEARRWFETAAQGNDADAMAHFGFMLESGRGGAVDLPGARLWYEKGAEAGSAMAMHNLATMLNDGKGGPENLPDARRWFEKAAEAGHAGAMVKLAALLDSGRLGSKDTVQAKLWRERAAQPGKAVARDKLRMVAGR